MNKSAPDRSVSHIETVSVGMNRLVSHGFGAGGSQIAGRHRVREVVAFVRAIAEMEVPEWLHRQNDTGCPSTQAKCISILIHDLKIALPLELVRY